MSQAPPAPVLRATNVHKRFGDTEVLKGIDLAVEEGEVVAIIGASGSGKTTFLRCVNLLEEYEQGEIRVAGETIGYREQDGRRRRLGEGAISAQRARIGMVFQSFNLFPHMTARENVMLGLTKVQGRAKAEAAAIAERWLTRVGLADRQAPLPVPALGRPAAAGRDRARDRDGAQAHAVRRGHLRARPGARRRGPGGDAGPRQRAA